MKDCSFLTRFDDKNSEYLFFYYQSTVFVASTSDFRASKCAFEFAKFVLKQEMKTRTALTFYTMLVEFQT